MSFSGEVKKELVQLVPSSRHCRIAEIAAFVMLLGVTETDGDGLEHLIGFRTDNPDTASLLFTLFQRAYNIELSVSIKEEHRHLRRSPLTVTVPGGVPSDGVMKSLRHRSVLQMACCRKAFLRGAFLAAGSVSDPEKSYHLEIVCPDEPSARLLRDTMQREGLDGRIVQRKKDHVVYLKEGDMIVEMLGAMGGSISFLNVENVRIMKEMRGSVNRQVNCETANLNKTIVSAVRQIEDIRYIRDHTGLQNLPESLREMAEVRLAFPDMPLAELGKQLDPQIGKSGVNHRLRKLSSIAASLRGASPEP